MPKKKGSCHPGDWGGRGPWGVNPNPAKLTS